MSFSKMQSTEATISRPVSLISLLTGICKIPTLIRANISFFNNDPCQRDLISLYKTERFVGRVQSLLYIF